MALIGIMVDEVSEYICKDEEGKENPTVFEIGHITHAQKVALMGNIEQAQKNDTKGEMINCLIDVCHCGIRKIRNIVVKGVAVDVEIVDKKDLEVVGLPVITELGSEVLAVNGLGDTERKN